MLQLPQLKNVMLKQTVSLRAQAKQSRQNKKEELKYEKDYTLFNVGSFACCLW